VTWLEGLVKDYGTEVVVRDRIRGVVTDEAAVRARYGVAPRQLPDLFALTGPMEYGRVDLRLAPAVKDALKDEVAQAIAAGVFGSPFVIVDGEPFWGLDRIEQVERWLATGAF